MKISEEVIDTGNDELLVIVKVMGNFKPAFECQDFPPNLRFHYRSHMLTPSDHGVVRFRYSNSDDSQTKLSRSGELLIGLLLSLHYANTVSISYQEMKVLFGFIRPVGVDMDFFKLSVAGQLQLKNLPEFKSQFVAV